MLSRLPIRSKLLLAFCVTVLPLISIMGVSAHREWKQRQALGFNGHREVAAAVAAALHEFLQNFADTQQAMGIAALYQMHSRESFEAYIDRVAEANPHLLGYAVVGANGIVQRSEPDPAWWQTLPDQSDVTAVRSGSDWAVSGLQRADNGTPVVTVTTSLPGSRQLLRAAIDVRVLNRLLALPLRPGWRVIIVDRQGQLIYHSLDPNRAWDRRDWRHDLGVWEARAQGHSRRMAYQSRIDGQWCLSSYTRVDPSGWVVGSSSPIELTMAPVRAAMFGDCLRIMLALATSLLLILILGRQISLPVERLAAAATRLGHGSEASAVPVQGQDELAVLARAFNTMAGHVREREEQLRAAEQAERQQRHLAEAAFEREHAIAATLQRAFLPQNLPDCAGYRFGAAYHPALQEAEVGGDFYDVFSLPGGRIGLLQGDVSGKGVTAAVYATMTRYLFRAYARETPSPAGVLQRVNQALDEVIEEDAVFVTAFYAVLDPEKDILRYANAGHWPPLLVRARGTEVVGGTAPALAVTPEAVYRDGQVRLEPGDGLLVYTDGLVETGVDDPMVHLEALQESLHRQKHEPPQQLVESLYQAALHRRGTPLRDDVALLALQREPILSPAAPSTGPDGTLEATPAPQGGNHHHRSPD